MPDRMSAEWARRGGTVQSPALGAVTAWRRPRKRPENYLPPGVEPGFEVPEDELCELVFV